MTRLTGKTTHFLLLLALVAVPVSASAAGLTAAKIVAGDEMLLSDGRTLHLEGTKAPDAGNALAGQARDKLQNLVGDQPLTLEDASVDRYGETVAQVYVQRAGTPKVSLQAEMLRAGLAFVYPPEGTEAGLADMLKTESEARKAQRGIWTQKEFQDLAAEKAKYHTGHFIFVSGTVVDARRAKNKIYLNFGDDWHEDLTVTIAAHDLHNFRKAGIDPLDYQGKTLRVRGWLKRDYGPAIEATNPGQIEVVGR